ncbi:MAG: NADH-quinone oxidoreductase subunit J [Ignavibacteriales bacterium]|nr:NADH-quinone oxidoreductase subunit J [Ignavibacteriales bacterium]
MAEICQHGDGVAPWRTTLFWGAAGALGPSPVWFVGKVFLLLFVFIWFRRVAAPVPIRPAHDLRLEATASAGPWRRVDATATRRRCMRDGTRWDWNASCSLGWRWWRRYPGLLVIVQRHAVCSALYLIITMGALAGLYVLLEAHFVWAVQVLVYAGAIMVLFLFVIMLVEPAARGRAWAPRDLRRILLAAGLARRPAGRD